MPNKNPEEVDYQSFLFQIVSHHLGYHFGIDKSYHPQGPYSDFAELEITGRGIRPKNVKDLNFTMWFTSRRDLDQILNETKSLDYEPQAIGKLTRRGDTRNYIGGLPYSAIWGVADLIEKGSADLVHLSGEKMRYGRAKIFDVGFFSLLDFDEEDYF